MLLHDAVVGLIGVPDCILRLARPWMAKLDDVVTSPPALRLAVLSIGYGLADMEDMSAR
jgi:hypothetical protein